METTTTEPKAFTNEEQAALRALLIDLQVSFLDLLQSGAVATHSSIPTSCQRTWVEEPLAKIEDAIRRYHEGRPQSFQEE